MLRDDYLISDESSPKKAAIAINNLGVKEVVITLGSRGSLVYVDNEFHEIPAHQTTTIVDPTGCGDTYMAEYIFKRQTVAP